MKIETVPFDAASYLTDCGAQGELLADAIQSGDVKYIAAALETIARAQRLARSTTSDSRSEEAFDFLPLSPIDDPRLGTFLDVTKSLGMTLSVTSRSDVRDLQE